jgi:hypothetical protein
VKDIGNTFLYHFTIRLTFLPYCPYLFSIQHTFLLYFPYHFTIQLTFLPYCRNHFTIQFIFLVKLNSEKICKIKKKIIYTVERFGQYGRKIYWIVKWFVSLFNLSFFHIFHIVSHLSLLFSIYCISFNI